MKRWNLYHLATLILLAFFFGHTVGGLFMHKSANYDEIAVRKLMKEVHFPFQGSTCNYFDFYFGFGLIVSIFFLFSAFITWQMAKPNAPLEFRPIGWALFVSYLVVAIVSAKYFFAGPLVTSLVLAAIFGYRSWVKPGVPHGVSDRN